MRPIARPESLRGCAIFLDQRHLHRTERMAGQTLTGPGFLWVTSGRRRVRGAAKRASRPSFIGWRAARWWTCTSRTCSTRNCPLSLTTPPGTTCWCFAAWPQAPAPNACSSTKSTARPPFARQAHGQHIDTSPVGFAVFDKHPADRAPGRLLGTGLFSSIDSVRSVATPARQESHATVRLSLFDCPSTTMAMRTWVRAMPWRACPTHPHQRAIAAPRPACPPARPT
jgi:hypothetical protein